MKMKIRHILNFTLGVFYLLTGSSLYGFDTTRLTDNQTIGQDRISAGLRRNGTSYTIERGDCLGKILREKFKLPDEVIFSPNTQAILMEANPHLHSLNDLRAGEQLIVPVNLLRLQPPAIVDSVKRPSDVHQHLDDISHPETSDSPAAITTVDLLKKTPPHEYAPLQAYGTESDDIPIQEKTIVSGETLDRGNKVRKLLSSFAAAFGGVENSSCEKKLEIDYAGSFTLDCSKFPLYELPWGRIILLDYGERLPPELQKIIPSAWKQTEILSVNESSTAKIILDKFIDISGLQKLESGNRYIVNQNNTQIMVIGDWIVINEADHKNIFIISIDDGPSLPDPLKKYLAKLGFNFILLADHRAGDCPYPEFSSGQSVENRTDPAAFTDTVLDLAGISYQRNVRTKLISQHEIGITLEVSSDRKFLLHGKPCLIVFKNISENISNLFQNQGYKILRIDRSQHLNCETVQNLLNFIGIKNTAPIFNFQYDHSNKTSIKITFPGFLLQTKKGDVLLTNTKIDPDMINLFIYFNTKIIYF